jgi:2-oxoglutarate dehydrogenase E1 component
MAGAPFFSPNAAFLADLKQSFDQNPDAIPDAWRVLFDDFDPRDMLFPTPSWAQRDAAPPPPPQNDPGSTTASLKRTPSGTTEVLRRNGYLFARTNPLAPAPVLPDDLKAVSPHLKTAYTGPLALELGHLVPDEARSFFYELWEVPPSTLSRAQKQATLNHLLKAEVFEQTLAKQFPGAKRFSLEGAEALLAGLEHLCASSAPANINHIVIGMSHRGRLNILTHLLDTPLGGLFDDTKDRVPGANDVPYHLGWTNQRDMNGQPLTLTLLPNPSHLEATDPVTLGYVRALQDASRTKSALGVLIHGEAAFSGQGVVMESLVLQTLKGYETGGTIHVVIDNQVGFTAEVDETCPRGPCDVAHMVGAPVIHVNGQDMDAVLRAFDRALAYRNRFHKDCVIHLICFRRHGHNELDEPRFTNPKLYKAVDETPSVTRLYGQQCVLSGMISEDDLTQRREALATGYKDALKAPPHTHPINERQGAEPPNLTKDELQAIGQALTTRPEHVAVHPKITRFVDKRRAMLEDGEDIDWSLAEALAFGSLLLEQRPVRLSGQDSVRGTFTQRHGAFIDSKNGARFTPLNQLDGAKITLTNSPLSEMAALGFEVGYSWAAPSSFVLWEAQFGDFANGAQVIIDQYLVPSRTKWGQTSSLTLLLPHGYEGQGSEHSSARLERFLQSAACDNIRVANVTTPANFFHLLRRQAYDVPRPLVVMTPKSLLRHPRAVSRLDDFTRGSFQPVLTHTPQNPKRVLLCSGKIYYDLLAQNNNDVAIVRLEQLYPFPKQQLESALQPLAQKNLLLAWVQEEPENMGAWPFVAPHLTQAARALGFDGPGYVGRPTSDITATSSKACHTLEQNTIITRALSQDPS